MALIRLEHVSLQYGDRIALSDVTLAFEPTEWVFVLGRAVLDPRGARDDVRVGRPITYGGTG